MTVTRTNRILEKLRLKAALCRRIWSSFDEDHRRRGVEVSFSQSGEDILSLYALRRLGITVPGYIDIGANHPTKFSNTYLFYLLGGRGLNIEPDPEMASLIRKERPRDETLNVGAGQEAGELEFFIMAQSAFNTFSRADAEEVQRTSGIAIKKAVKVKVENIGVLLRERRLTPDFLNVDVEGMDMDILASIDWECTRPGVVCVETVDYATQQKRPEVTAFMREKDYEPYADTFLNTIYIDGRKWGARRENSKSENSEKLKY